MRTGRTWLTTAGEAVAAGEIAKIALDAEHEALPARSAKVAWEKAAESGALAAAGPGGLLLLWILLTRAMGTGLVPVC